jgi:TolB-like protein
MTDDENDSVLRAVAAAPPAAPPVRLVTVVVVRPSDSVPIPDQWDLVRKGAAELGVEVERRDGRFVIVWSGNTATADAARCALEIRDALPATSIALATANVEHGRPPVQVIERALELLGAEAGAIRVDAETAQRVEQGFSLDFLESGSRILLVAEAQPEAAARVGRTIGNYKIVRLLGSGGMGVVYLAEHKELGRKAVIKFVHGRLSDRDELATRFFLEAKAAASIRHPGIVDVFDYGRDDQGSPYIVMEFLDGESLRARLRREHPLPTDLGVALAQQIASALGAAHEAGVIHRDLKPENIFVVRDRESPSGVRAKVLDFGLAKPIARGEQALTRTGTFVGTPVYMAPEQCRGREIDHRADIYALGCVLFEMVCGRVPFLDDTVGELIIAHNSMAPPSPRSLVPALPPALERTILRALAKSPADRQATMAEFAAELGEAGSGAKVSGLADTVMAAPRALRAERKRTRSRGWAIAAAAAVVALGAGITMSVRSRSASSQHATAGAGSSITVIDLRDRSSGTGAAWLGTALGEIVRTDLAASERLRVAPGSDVARMRADLGISDADSDSWSRERLRKVHDDLGADFVIAGSYTVVAGQIRAQLEIHDTKSGGIVGRANAAGAESDLRALAARLVEEVARVLGVESTGNSAAPTSSVLPAGTAAARAYAEGLAQFRRYELVEAQKSLQRASSEAPDDALVHSALAATWRELGYDAKAATEAKLAYDRSSTLPRENRLAIEGQYRETTAQWDQAIDAYRTLFEFFPTRLDYGLSLAAAQTHAGDAKSAYATLDSLRKLPGMGSDPRIELYAAEAAEAADDMERERTSAERAVSLARSRGARVILAKALFHQGWALWTQGRDAEAKRAYDEAKQIFTDLHDGSGLARCENNMGLAAHRDHRDDDAARSYDAALRHATEAGDTTAQAWVLQNFGVMYADQGELARAVDAYERELKLGETRQVGPELLAAAHANIAEVLRWHGDLASARTHVRTAEDLLRGLDARRYAAYTAYQLGEIERAEDDLAGAHKHLQQALVWASDVMTPAETAEIRTSLARAELDAGRAADAEEHARAAVADLRAAKETSQQICATAVLASALLARDRSADAARELASAPAREHANFACRLEADVVAARVMAADPAQRDAAIAALRTADEQAARLRFLQEQFEIDLARSQLGDADGHALARLAVAKGFKQIARRANGLAKSR